MFIEYLESPADIKILKDMPADMEILDSIKRNLLEDLHTYDLLPVTIKYNVNSVYEWHSQVIESIFKDVNTLYDVLLLVRFSFNSKLGNKILIFNLSAYFNCYGIKSRACTCSKICYAGKLAIRQLKKSISNYIFYQYIKRSGNLKLLELAIIYGTNKAIESVKGSFSDLKAIRFDEIGEIEDATDLFYLELIYYYLRQFKKSLKAYTYSTNKNLIKLFEGSEITVRISAGIKPEVIDQSFNNWSIIVEPETVLKAKEIAEAQGFKFILCKGSCKCCQACTLKNTCIGFVNHSGTTAKALEFKIKECERLLNETS